MNITREFIESDRYQFDFKYCTTKKGYAQIDTAEDAWYYGNWGNPTTRRIVSYVEGDLIVTQCDTDEEFVSAIREMNAWHEKNSGRRISIDPGFNEAIKQAYTQLGLDEFMYPATTQ